MSGKISVGLFDRLISSLSYLTVGWAGLIYCVILYFRKKSPSAFVRFNVFQSIFISLLYFVLAMALGLICDLLVHVPVINIIISYISYIFNSPLIFEYSILQAVVTLLILYLSIFSLLGRRPRIYWISRIIDGAAS